MHAVTVQPADNPRRRAAYRLPGGAQPRAGCQDTETLGWPLLREAHAYTHTHKQADRHTHAGRHAHIQIHKDTLTDTHMHTQIHR